MEHLSELELRHRLSEAEALVEKGARYAHYKHPEQSYSVIGFAIREDSQDVCVIYEAEYGETIPFIRTLASFVESVEVDGVSVPRFSRLP
ncbi:MAG TPA: DUF1653 domain-containing protein [Candidatus Paceibacterota bacterium]|nr:DUF1653 domain-containing protein [Candidatus Paceibacterota bacterium]